MQEISVDQYKFYSLNLSLTFLDFLFSIYTVAILFAGDIHISFLLH